MFRPDKTWYGALNEKESVRFVYTESGCFRHNLNRPIYKRGTQ